MAYYEELSPIMDGIICEKMLRNQNLCKLLYYYPDSSDYNKNFFPNFDYSVFEQPDIEDTSPMFMREIYPVPKMPDAKTEQKTYITVAVGGGYDPEVNSGYRNVSLLIDIICHLNAWKIREGYRPFLLMNEIDKMLNNKLTDLPIENKPYSYGFQPRDYSNYFYGVQLKYNLIINSNIICDPTPQNDVNNLKLEEERPIYMPRYQWLKLQQQKNQ